MPKTYGTIKFIDGAWHITADPFVMMRLKRVFERVDKNQFGTVTLKRNPETDRDLLWFIDRHPLRIEGSALELIKRGAKENVDRIQSLDELVSGKITAPKNVKLAKPLRQYQTIPPAMLLSQGYLLLGDELGLGKTIEAIAAMVDDRARPAFVCMYPHLQMQWVSKLQEFAPQLSVYVIPDTKGGVLPDADVYIVTYHKIHAWVLHLQRRCALGVFDEVQECRHSGSQKYAACKEVANSMDYVLGMSATPIYNLGGEIFNVFEVIHQGLLGTHEEFIREWCTRQPNGKYKLRDPDAFGSYVRDSHIMLRRTRQQVGRELPPVNRVPHYIDNDTRALDKIGDKTVELCKIILNRTEKYQGQLMKSSGQLDAMVRQATGIGKAPYIADFIQMLVDAGERPVVGLWHREVYQIIRERLAKETRVVMYSGSENDDEKERSKELFIRGDADVMLMSLRSGGGTDGLQGASSVAVIGELDWAPAVHEQFIGRLNRDGMDMLKPVTAYFLLSTEGSDPTVSERLGIKKSQIEGIINPNGRVFEQISTDGSHIRELAQRIMDKKLGMSRKVNLTAFSDGPIKAAPIARPALVSVKNPILMLKLPPKPLRIGVPANARHLAS